VSRSPKKPASQKPGSNSPRTRRETPEPSVRTAKPSPDEGKRSVRNRLARSPWLIAIAAPVIAAAVLGIYNATVSRITETLGTPISAYAGYDTNLYSSWLISTMSRLRPSALPANINSCDAMRQWLEANRAADISESHIRLHLVGTANGTVTVSGVHAQILSRRPASPTALVRCPSAGLVATPSVAMNLRQDAPIALEVGPVSRATLPADDVRSLAQRLGSPYFAAHVITLTKGEPFDLAVTGFIFGTETVRWRLVVDVEMNGQQTNVPVSGPIFTTAPLLCGHLYRQYWNWQWDLSPQRLVRAPPAEAPTCSANTLPY
jgi:hypothetical protein